MATKQLLIRLIPSFSAVCTILAFATLLALGLDGFADDPGVGWHLKNGQLITERLAVPRYDPFLAGPARPWISDQWLSDVLFHLIYRAGSWPLLYAALAGVFMAAFFGILYKGLVGTAGFRIVAAIVTIYTFKLAQVHLILRPVVLSFLLFAAVYVVLIQRYDLFRRNSEELIPRKLLLLMPLLFAVWANLHPAFVTGLLMLALLPPALMVDLLFEPQSAQRSSYRAASRRSLVLLVLCGLATLINPYGPALHSSIIELAGSRYFMGLHEEWAALDLRSVEGKFFAYGLLVLVVSFFYAPLRKRLGIWQLLLVVVFAHGALRGVRLLPFFGIVVSLPLVLALTNLAGILERRRWSWVKHLLASCRRFEALETRSLRPAPVLTILITIVVGFAASSGRLPLFPGPFGPQPSKYPYAALEVLRRSTTGGSAPAAVLADPAWGGFITFYGDPQLQPVIDDRNVLVGEEMYRRFYGEFQSGRGWLPFAAGTGARYLLIRPGSPLAILLAHSSTAAKLFEDHVSVLYEVIQETSR